MNRRNRRIFNEEKETNRIVIISFIVLLIAILAFVITFIIYRNYLNNKMNVAERRNLEIANLGKNNEVTSSETSSSIGKTVNEIQKSESIYTNTENQNNTERIAINTSNMKKEVLNEINNDNNMNAEEINNIEANMDNSEENTSNELSVQTDTSIQKTSVKEKIPDPTFKKPVEGEIVVEFAKDTLIYSNTLQEWVTHMRNRYKSRKNNNS